MTARMKIRPEILEQAAEHYCRLVDAESQAAVWPEVESWLAESEEHAAAYDAVEDAWWTAGELADSESIAAARREAVISMRVDYGDVKPARSRSIVAIAATVVLGVFVAALVNMTNIGLPGSGPATVQQTYQNTGGELLPVTLADNSDVVLDASSSVDVEFGDDARFVRLREGRARFNVAHDTERPFQVEVRDKVVVALGTIFDVDMIEGDIEITLLEGSVAVTDAVTSGITEATQLAPGQRLTIRSDGSSETRSDIDARESSAWQQGQLFFADEPIRRAVARINRYSSRQLVVADDVADHFTISGMFDAGDPESFVEALDVYLPGLAPAAVSFVEPTEP